MTRSFAMVADIGEGGRRPLLRSERANGIPFGTFWFDRAELAWDLRPYGSRAPC